MKYLHLVIRFAYYLLTSFGAVTVSAIFFGVDFATSFLTVLVINILSLAYAPYRRFIFRRGPTVYEARDALADESRIILLAATTYAKPNNIMMTVTNAPKELLVEFYTEILSNHPLHKEAMKEASA